MLAAREPRRVRDLRAFLRVGLAGRGQGRGAGAQEAQVRRGRAVSRSRARHLRQQAVAGREPQDQVAGVADQPAGDGDQPPAQGGDHGLAAAHAVPVPGCPALRPMAVSWCSQAAMARGEQRTPHPGHVHPGKSARGGGAGRHRACCRGRCSQGEARLHT